MRFIKLEREARASAILEFRELLEAQMSVLTHQSRMLAMISKEIQDLMAQAEKNVSITESLDLGFKALTSQVATLQQQVASLTADGVITAAEKAQIVQTTNDLAASFSTLQADIPANTAAAPAPASAPAPDAAAAPAPDTPPADQKPSTDTPPAS